MNENYTFFLPPSQRDARIGLLGGSFDPPHLGHGMLSLAFLALEQIDELWIVPCNDHAIKESLSTFAHRFAMCKLAFARLQNVRVLDIEQHLPAPNFTINTIKAIKTLRPDLNVYLGLGSDLTTSFPKWQSACELSTLAQFVIFERENYPCENLPSLLKNARVHKSGVLPNFNSTAFREELRKTTHQNACSYVDRAVMDYIQAHGLYS